MTEQSGIRTAMHEFINWLGKDYAAYGETILPPKRLRFCGGEFKDDSYFLVSAKKEAERLVKNCGLNLDSNVLDIGCGPGRLPIGILSYMGEVSGYEGLDVDERSIHWGQRHITKDHPMFRFSHLDIHNSRYNPKGSLVIDESFRFPFNDSEFDIIYLYSVFSHMTEREVAVYVSELRRLLKWNGKLFLTGFLEKDVPRVTVNPTGYRMDWKGDLHCVRFNKEYFTDLMVRNGLNVESFEYQTETDGQSAIYAVRPDANNSTK